MPRGLLARAACARFAHDWPTARQDLAYVFDAAHRSGMLLHLCDAHLEAARLALSGGDLGLSKPPIPTWARLSPAEHLAAAENLIDQTGYERRRLDLDYLQTHLPAERDL